jgi:serine phosphatase RsbU (regulator of sigma subunit)
MLKWKVTLCLLFSCFSFLSQGQDVYTASVGQEPVRIGNKFLFLKDPTHKLTFDEVFANGNFTVNNDDIPNYDVSTDAIWGKIKITCAQNADWYLQLEPSILNEITFYQKRGNNAWTRQSLGNKILPENRAIPFSHVFLKLDLLKGDTTILIFRAADYYPMQFNFTIGSIESFSGSFQDVDMYNGVCFGVMLMMLIYNLYLYLTQKQKVYLYYVLYLISSGIFSLVFTGYFIYVPHFLQSIIFFDPIVFPAAFGIFLIIFTVELFKGYLTKPILYVLYFFLVIVLIDVLLGAIDYKIAAFNMIRILGLLLGVACITAGVIAHRRGSTSAMFYIVGFGFYLGGLAFLILSGHLLPTNTFAFKAVLTGSMLESVFLSFAQGDKLKVFQLEKEKAQEETVIQLQKNERLIKEQNIVLEQKVKERTAELAEKNKEVTDSIHYAKRIQGTLLAQESELKQNIPEHFILFKPKDIVSGDFYWASQKENKFYVAVCDSTGHGVPGAFMSLLNISFLNEAVNEKDIVEPNEVFNYVRKHLINSISRDGGRDGMDGILACMERTGATVRVKYAASNNNPLLMRNNEMIELPSDKMPVGQGEIMDSFTLNEIELQKGDVLYLYTDGYADQFGGPKGKKFKYKQFTEELQKISREPIHLQKEMLNSIFESWKGDLEQIDDVLILGIRI